jgi:hypothetical protein
MAEDRISEIFDGKVVFLTGGEFLTEFKIYFYFYSAFFINFIEILWPFLNFSIKLKF